MLAMDKQKQEEKQEQKKEKKLNKQTIIEEFDVFAKAKKMNVIYFASALCFAFLVVFCVLIWGYRISVKAVDKVLVVDRSGEYLKTFSAENEKLFYALMRNTCALTTKYANSFDRFTIKENQVKVLFYANETDLETIFNKYNADASYHEALQNGVIYKCEIEDIQQISGDNQPYTVYFTSILNVEYQDAVANYRIYSEGQLVRTTPQFPENVTGFFFLRYKQTIQRVDLEAERKEREKLELEQRQKGVIGNN
ncbi:hypothetical protein TF3313_2855 [Tannerella forsythia 3313]|nr:hypothetical protein TF3313_2855 [Tannerella forsythia 3313]